MARKNFTAAILAASRWRRIHADGCDLGYFEVPADGLRSTSMSYKLAVNGWQGAAEGGGARHDGVAATAEYQREVLAGAGVDGHAEDDQPLLARCAHGHAGVFNRPAAFVMVGVVGLAVGQHQQQAM